MRRARTLPWVGLAVGLLLSPSLLHARGVAEESGGSRPPLPDFQVDAPIPFVLPVVPPAEAANAPSELLFGVERFEFVGNTAIPAELLSEVVAPWRGPGVSARGLREAVEAVTRRYVEEGFVNSRALLPDQDVESGTVVIRIEEGKLGRVRVTGNQALRASAIEDRVQLHAGSPLNIRTLERSLRILRRYTLVDTVRARLVEGSLGGVADLELEVEERQRWTAGAAYTNRQAPAIGEHGALLDFKTWSLSGFPDELAARARLTEGLVDLNFAYSVEVSKRGTWLGARGRYAQAKIVESPFDVLDIESESYLIELSAFHPLLRTPTDSVEIGVIGIHRDSEATILGFPLPTLSSADGKDRITALRFVGAWTHAESDRAFSASSRLSVGTDWFGGTKAPSNVADSRFVAWLGQLQYAERFDPWALLLRGRIDLQVSNDPLLPLERIPAGGYASVRGYRENRIVRDNAVISSLELTLPFYGRRYDGPWFAAGPFADYGRAWNEGASANATEDLASLGIVTRFGYGKRFLAEISWGAPLFDLPSRSGALQDDGISVAVEFRL